MDSETSAQQPPTRERVSACLIVQNERERLPAALASLAFCDEIIVVDGGSTDGTQELARAAGARVIENPWPGFAAQRNVSIDAATGDWVLEVDADERISPRLRASIEALLCDPPSAGEDIAIFALRNRFLGGELGASAKYPAYRARLFRRGSHRHNEGRAVHEGIELRRRPIVLAGDLEHELAGTLGEALRDLWRYASLESRHVRRPDSARGLLNGILLRPAAKFAYRLVIDGGWRDGWRGLVKIAIDAGSDGLVWALVAVRGGSASEEPGGTQASEHWGKRMGGPLKVVAVAGRGRSTEAATAWLQELAAHGADVALVSPESVAGGVPQQTLRRLRPLALIRALEMENHIRPIGAVVAVGAGAERTLRLVPGSLRPQVEGLAPGAPLEGLDLAGS